MAEPEIVWDLPSPFIHPLTAQHGDIDGFGHVNNAVYLRWLVEAAWAHSEALGLSEARCVELDRGMVVRRHEIEYLRSARAGEELLVGTWIVSNDGRLTSNRRYQLVRKSDGATLVRGFTCFVCANLSTGAPARMPQEFAAYAVEPDIALADENNPWGD